jgi:Fic family protein
VGQVIFRTPTASATLTRQLAELDELRARLDDDAGSAGLWLGSLRRQLRASTAESSIEIEGFHVPEEERVAVASGRGGQDLRDNDRMALSCYAHAMDHVGIMSSDPVFRWVDRVILDLHFDACSFQRDNDPGRYRERGIEVTAPGGGPPAYIAPPAREVPALMQEVLAWLAHEDLDAHVAIRAAMAHLHVVSVHPFRDGNGRISRIVQSLVLAREGPLAPEFVSIEEYLGRNTGAYYSTLQEVQGGRYDPDRDAAPWITFCVGAHVEQARRRLKQIDTAATRWSFLELIVERRHWPDRLVIALEQSLFQGVDRASYAAEADIALPTASNDLRRLLDACLLASEGKGRSTRYRANASLRTDLRAHLEQARPAHHQGG